MSSLMVFLGIILAIYFYKNKKKHEDNIINTPQKTLKVEQNSKKKLKEVYVDSGYKKQYIYEQEILGKDMALVQSDSELENKIRRMPWRKFEFFVAKVFEKNGYTCAVTPKSNDGGKDIIATKNGQKFFIECKHFYKKKSIGREIIQKLVGAGMQYHCKNLIVVTTSDYHQNAIEAAKEINKEDGLTIKLMDIYDLIDMIKVRVNEYNINNYFPKGLKKMGCKTFFTFYIDFNTLKVTEETDYVSFKVNLNCYNASTLQTVYKYMFKFNRSLKNGNCVEYSIYDACSDKYIKGSANKLEILCSGVADNEVDRDLFSILETYYNNAEKLTTIIDVPVHKQRKFNRIACPICGEGRLKLFTEEDRPLWMCNRYPLCKAKYPDLNGKPHFK